MPSHCKNKIRNDISKKILIFSSVYDNSISSHYVFIIFPPHTLKNDDMNMNMNIVSCYSYSELRKGKVHANPIKHVFYASKEYLKKRWHLFGNCSIEYEWWKVCKERPYWNILSSVVSLQIVKPKAQLGSYWATFSHSFVL